MRKHLFSAFVAGAALVSCSHGVDNWKVNGTLSNADTGAKIAVERLVGYGWIPVDSVTVGSDGSFAYTAPAGMPSHDIFRLTYGGKSIYFPIDTLDTVNVSADASTFDTGYTISGTQLADDMMAIETLIADGVRNNGVEYVLNDTDFRRGIETAIVDDPTGVLSYYFINKKIGDHPLFSESRNRDVSIMGAVANKFATIYPDDPRTVALARKAAFARAALHPEKYQGETVEANVSGLIDLDMVDEKGVSRKLSDTAADAGVTILNFTSYLGDWSVPYNVELNRLYEEFKDKKLAVYQVAFDADEVEWTQTARNLPWVTVLCPPDKSQTVVLHYNVNVVPLAYIIDGNGDIVERVDIQTLTDDSNALEKAVRRAMK